MGPLVWVHEDALGSDHPVFEQAGTDAMRVFIWDNQYFQSQGYSLKRLVFIYECLADIPELQLYQGDTEAVLANIIGERDLFVAETANPKFRRVIETLSKDVTVTQVAGERFSAIAANSDMGRFFRYWNRARKSALSVDGIE